MQSTDCLNSCAAVYAACFGQLYYLTTMHNMERIHAVFLKHELKALSTATVLWYNRVMNE